MSNIELAEEPMFKSKSSSLMSSVYDVHEVYVSPHQRKKPQPPKTEKVLAFLKTKRVLLLTISYSIAVVVDPLFFYLVVIDDEKKCIGMDTILRNVALILRSLTDIGFVLNIIHKIREAVDKTRTDKDKESLPTVEKINTVGKLSRNERKEFAKALALNLSWLSIAIDFFAILPIPQVVIIGITSSTLLRRRTILNFILLAQYLPRVYRMKSSSKKLRPNTGVYVKGSFYVFLYMLASHVLGAFWYYFSIQQETSCWHRSCAKNGGRDCNFYCHENMINRNKTFSIDKINEYCGIDVPENKTFDYGIFLDSLKNNNTAPKPFSKKFFYSFWWGLRNLSNFGTNLETSTYVWENCFAILISITGILLFLYLIGKVQTFISMKTEKSEERRKKFQSKEIDIQMWMTRNNLNKEMRKSIQDIINEKWEEIQNADIQNLYSILPAHLKKSIKQSLCIETLKKVPKLKILKDEALQLICQHLKPVVHFQNSYVFQVGEPLDRILFITEGLVWTFEPDSSSSPSQDGKGKTGFLQKGGFYGDHQLLSWAIASPKDDHLAFGNLPISKVNVKSHTKVEGFVLMAKDLKTVVSNRHWGFRDSEEKEETASKCIQKVARRFIRRKKHPLTAVFEDESSQPLPAVVGADAYDQYNWPVIANKDL